MDPIVELTVGHDEPVAGKLKRDRYFVVGQSLQMDRAWSEKDQNRSKSIVENVSKNIFLDRIENGAPVLPRSFAPFGRSREITYFGLELARLCTEVLGLQAVSS